MEENDYGIYKENLAGVIEWVVVVDPLVMGSEADAIDTMSEEEARDLAGTLGEGFAPGRPKRPPNV